LSCELLAIPRGGEVVAWQHKGLASAGVGEQGATKDAHLRVVQHLPPPLTQRLKPEGFDHTSLVDLAVRKRPRCLNGPPELCARHNACLEHCAARCVLLLCEHLNVVYLCIDTIDELARICGMVAVAGQDERHIRLEQQVVLARLRRLLVHLLL
jgi:hypothetical protein